MVDSDGDTCLTLPYDLAYQTFSTGDCKANYRINFYVMPTTLTFKTEVKVKNASCENIHVVLDEHNYSVETYSKKYLNCQLNKDETTADTVCSFDCKATKILAKMTLVYFDKNDSDLAICDFIMSN